nr:unnamed protein product [Callosobruchus analis]
MARDWNRRVDKYRTFMKYSLVGINAVSLVCGFIVVILGIWTIASRFFANDLLGTNLYSGAAYILMITSIFVILVSVLGCLGAVKEVRCLLVIVSILTIHILFVMGLHCCGIYDYRDWKNQIPQSCCKLTATGQMLQCQTLGENNNDFTIFTEGCLEVTKEFVRGQAVVIGTSGVVMSVIIVSTGDDILMHAIQAYEIKQ